MPDKMDINSSSVFTIAKSLICPPICSVVRSLNCIKEFYHVKVSIVEKTILKTIIYASLFDYPLKAWEIHKWLIGKKLNLKQVEKGLSSLVRKRKINTKSGFSFLRGKNNLVLKRKQRERISKDYLTQASAISSIFKLILSVK